MNLELIDFIKQEFPSSWLSNLYLDIDEAGIEIAHPKNTVEYLTILVLPNIIGIGILLEEDRDISLDLSGFDLSFEIEEIPKAKDFLRHFMKTAQIDRYSFRKT